MDPASLLCAHEYRENGCKFADLKWFWGKLQGITKGEDFTTRFTDKDQIIGKITEIDEKYWRE